MTSSPLLLISACGFLNGLRGRGLIPAGRIACCLGIGVAFGLAALESSPPTRAALLGAATAAGVYLWALPGWGKYFSSITGRDDPAEREIAWIDRVGYAAFPAGRNRARGTLCMALRGLYLYPLFLALAYLVTPWAALVGLGCLLQGPCYWLAGVPGEENAVPRAEVLFGFVVGLMLAATLP